MLLVAELIHAPHTALKDAKKAFEIVGSAAIREVVRILILIGCLCCLSG
jgi:hypothetical protein